MDIEGWAATFFRVANGTIHIPCPYWCYMLPKVIVKGFLLFECNWLLVGRSLVFSSLVLTCHSERVLIYNISLILSDQLIVCMLWFVNSYLTLFLLYDYLAEQRSQEFVILMKAHILLGYTKETKR
jgi:hypothetical protein